MRPVGDEKSRLRARSRTVNRECAVRSVVGTTRSNAAVTDDDVGRRVVTPHGVAVGSVAETRNGVAYVEPDGSIAAMVAVARGWGDRGTGASFRVDPAVIEDITDRRIVVR